MAETPAHVKQVRGADRRILSYKDELVKVQNFYVDHRYKQCISLSEELQRPEIHALHRVFLWFYRAASYEAMGLIAHEFSKNKQEYLELAQGSFKSALSVLPLPYVSREQGFYNQPEGSPLYADWHVSPINTKKETILDSPTPGIANPSMTHSASACSIYSPATNISSIDFAVSTPPMSDLATAEANKPQQEHVGCNHLKSPHTPLTHRTRLSQSLSNSHALAEELVPSPLFSRACNDAETAQPQTDTTYRPLPPLPFAHKANFEVQGSRIVQIPTMRKTAVQTLIARYEGCLPVLQSPVETSTPSPVTPRFRMIHNAFSPDPSNDHLDAYLSSASLTRYNASLADFASQLRKHICFLDGELARVRSVQDERATAKTLTNNRLASFWTLSTASTSAAARRQQGDDHEDVDGEEPVLKAKKERINRLRLAGWNVRKEKHGYKGEEWYNSLRRRLERELDEYAMLRS
ncbi:hypothetical protein PV11_00769 [Exophiala sideris]|uniref:Uncharacterized protein n=1 Tax=Exophiala sideris TaxID=1016849 RepID=A0A0D1ZE39_9EURO|nr:hypothetical protein PV11_00769 [Exophiala sideris]